MRSLTKYVVVTESGTWLHFCDEHAGAAQLAERAPGTHVERWTYPVLDDGTHGTPAKARC